MVGFVTLKREQISWILYNGFSERPGVSVIVVISGCSFWFLDTSSLIISRIWVQNSSGSNGIKMGTNEFLSILYIFFFTILVNHSTTTKYYLLNEYKVLLLCNNYPGIKFNFPFVTLSNNVSFDFRNICNFLAWPSKIMLHWISVQPLSIFQAVLLACCCNMVFYFPVAVLCPFIEL